MPEDQEALAELVREHHNQEQDLLVQDPERQGLERQGLVPGLQLQDQEQAEIQLNKQFDIYADHLIHDQRKG
jgi:hypothetical protein